MRIHRVGLWCNCEKDSAIEAAKHLLEIFHRHGVEISVNADLMSAASCPDCDTSFDRCDLMITFGGDGTLLTGLKYAVESDIPVLGINMGHVGFLTELEPGCEDACVQRLLYGEYNIEERMLLETSVAGCPVALNDATVTRAPSSGRILTAEVYVNGSLAESFSGDGLIVSTPTGSTAYSFAAGGPVVQPDMKLLLLTPICPHTLNTRPMIVPANATVEIAVTKGSEGMLAMDGKVVYYIANGERITLRESGRRARFIRLNDENFYDRLRSKLMDWGH